MPTITDLKKDMEFYQDFSSLIEALKAITVSQFHALEKKIMTFDEFDELLCEICKCENMTHEIDFLDNTYIQHD